MPRQFRQPSLLRFVHHPYINAHCLRPQRSQRSIYHRPSWTSKPQHTMDATCQCGSVSFTTPLEQPLALYICHCDDCKRQTSSAFGTSAIFPRFPLPKDELLSVYKRQTQLGQTLYCYFCRQCGTRLIHSTPEKNVVSVKGGCIAGLDWSKAIHIWTKSAMVPIPEGSESYSEGSEEKTYGPTQETLDQPGPLMGS